MPIDRGDNAHGDETEEEMGQLNENNADDDDDDVVTLTHPDPSDRTHSSLRNARDSVKDKRFRTNYVRIKPLISLFN